MLKKNLKRRRMIQAAMIRRGISVSEIAAELNLSVGHVSKVIRRERGSQRVDAALIKAGVPERLFR